MSKLQTPFSLVLSAIVVMFAGAGCSAPADNHNHAHGDDNHSHGENHTHGDDHDHDHAHDDDHDHGDDGHSGHHHAAPHGGSLIPLGDHVGHAEIVIDDAGKVTVYFLDGEAEAPIRLTHETIAFSISPDGGDSIDLELTAVENVLTGETVGDSSQFEAQAPELAGVETATGTIGAITFRGMDFEEVAFTYPEGEE